MYYNTQIENWVKTFQKSNGQKTGAKTTELQMEPQGRSGPIFFLEISESINNLGGDRQNPNNNINKATEEANYFDPFHIPEKFVQKTLWFVLFPLKFLFYLTMPDNRRKIFKNFYFLTFLISTIYIGVFTYGIVWMVVIISYKLNIPDTVAGLTLLAAGSSLPEVVSSVIITRQGKGEMAISNSIGSNSFDILICLGFPWLLENLISNTNKPIHVYSGGIFYSTSILLASLIVLLALFYLNKWKLNKRFGGLMLALWVIVTILTCLFEYDVFGKFSIPFC
jgi:Ca2+/Na+ antiporter